MTKGEIEPTEEDLKIIEAWVKGMESSILPPYSKVEPVDWNKFNNAYKKHIGFSSGVPLGKVQSFYQSNHFDFCLKRGDKTYLPQLISFHTEKAYHSWRKKNRFLVYRCIVGDSTTTGKRYVAAYYHKDFGKVGWIQAKLQYFVNRFSKSNNLIKWFYGLNTKPLKFKINLTWGD